MATFLIVIPARNAAAHLATALESVVAQDRTGIRVHVHVQDGGSNDGTIEIARGWAARFSATPQGGGLVITWASAADGGMYDAITRSLADASERPFTPELFFWLNADDVLMPGALRNLATTFADPGVVWVIGAAVDIDEAAAVTLLKPHPRIPEADLRTGNFNYTGGRWLRAESTAVRLSAARACGPFTAGLRLAGDYELFVKLARRVPPTWVDYPVRGFRRHPGQLSQAAVAYQHERSRARFLFGADGGPSCTRPIAASSREIVFFPDRRESLPYQRSLYEAARARGVSSIDELQAVCREATAPLIVHVHWLDGITGQPDAAGVSAARRFAETITAARAQGHRVVFTLHEVPRAGRDHADLERGVVQFLFQQADRVHMHHPTVASEVRERCSSFPWGRVMFAEQGSFPGPPRVSGMAGLALFQRDGVVQEFGSVPAVFADLHGSRATALPTEDEWRDAVTTAKFALLGPASESLTIGLAFAMLAAGTPVIAPRVGRIPSYVFDGSNGFLYEPGDDASCRTAVGRALAERFGPAEQALRERVAREVALLDWRSSLDTILRGLA